MRKFAPLTAEHPILERECPGCNEAFEVGDEVTLLTIGPGADPDARKRWDEGRAYDAIAIPVHRECSEQTS